MLTAYFDESTGGNPPHFFMSGYVSDERGWRRFEKEWKIALSDEHLPFIHWKDFLGGYKEYKQALGGEEKRQERERIAKRFLSIITNRSFNLQGIYASFALSDFEEFSPIIRQLGIESKYAEPYHLGFQSVIQRLMTMLRSDYALDEDEVVNFVFDRHKDYGGAAKELFDGMTENPLLWFRRHLGALCFADMRRFAPLQAADVLANECQRDMKRLPGQERRKFMTKLMSGKRLEHFDFSKRYLDMFRNDLRENFKKQVGRYPDE